MFNILFVLGVVLGIVFAASQSLDMFLHYFTFIPLVFYQKKKKTIPIEIVNLSFFVHYERLECQIHFFL